MVEFTKPNKCPKCGARTSKTHTGVVYLRGRVNRKCSISSSDNNVGFICVQCGYYEVKYKPPKLEMIVR